MPPNQADTEDTVDLKKPFETDASRAQDASAPHKAPEAQHATKRYNRETTQQKQEIFKRYLTEHQRITTKYQHFAERLADAMRRSNVSASEVARRVWGTTKDRRGYDVARNRDRIGHYLSGKSYPEPENLAKLAEALGVTVEDIAMPEGDNPGPRAPRGTTHHGRPQLTMTFEASGKIRVRGQIDLLFNPRRLQELIDLLVSERMPEPVTVDEPEIGSVIKNDNHG
jgi:transcriptional regulator with XRE-family HTH domain